jgi:hypothetical protein
MLVLGASAVLHADTGNVRCFLAENPGGGWAAGYCWQGPDVAARLQSE